MHHIGRYDAPVPGAWPPPIAEPELIERLTLDDAGFRDYMLRFIAQVPSRACDADAFARACAYPWERPTGSYLLADGDVQLLAELSERRAWRPCDSRAQAITGKSDWECRAPRPSHAPGSRDSWGGRRH